MNLTNILNEKVVVYDGAMGTSIQKKKGSPDVFWGKSDCNEILNLSKPEVIKEIHASFLEVGCDVIETNTFNGSSLSLSDHDLADKTYEINKSAAEIASEVARDFSTTHPRFVAGSIGPTAKLPTLEQIDFDTMLKSYKLQIRGLLDGGVDLLIIETCQDILQTKIAIIAALQVFSESNIKIPLHISLTVDKSGKMLLGTDIGSALTTLLEYPVDIIGLNCSTGPEGMSEPLHYLSEYSPCPIAVIPNAGFPREVDGEIIYDLEPEKMASTLSHYVNDLDVNIIGGCCGTTPAHIKAMVNVVSGLSSPKRTVTFSPSISSLFSRVSMDMEPKPLLIAERTNANGSKTFKKLLIKGDLDGLTAFAREQISLGAHTLDVCVSIVGKDEIQFIKQVVPQLNQKIDAPLMIDSTNPEAIEDALKRISGKAIVNSINLENGEDQFGEIIGLCKQYGAAVVALSIDEKGMGKTASRKYEIARRIFKLAVKKYGFSSQNIFYDPLTFTLATGDQSSSNMGIETLKAIEMIKRGIPEANTILGISNISYGLSKNARKAINSVFLHEAIKAGLDAAIFNVSHFIPLHQLDPSIVDLCLDLIYNLKRNVLSDIIEYFSSKTLIIETQVDESLTPDERLKRVIIDGDNRQIEEIIDQITTYSPLEIINQILLPVMQEVGERFESGEMPLPFVLQSAEVMKQAVSVLEPKIKGEASRKKGILLLATVKGDVHDIGKNLVDIIVSNNGYEVVDLGIKQSINDIIAAIDKYNPDVLGLSGLLVKSTVIMKENLQILNERGIKLPVILGGAALTKNYVENILQNIYHGNVYYASDAFAGLRIMNNILTNKK